MALSAGTVQISPAAAAGVAQAEIYDICATNCYAPYLSNPAMAKFVVVFDSRSAALSPLKVSYIYVRGPEGIVFWFRNRPFDRTYYNGYMYDPASNVLWYQGYIARLIPDGEYTFCAVLKDGTLQEKSRYLQTNYELLEAYITYQPYISFYPPNGQQIDGTLCRLQWTTLSRLGGPDAYYNSWLVGLDNQVALSDSIFTQSVWDPDAGLNTGWSWKSSPPLKEGTYQWFTEILDANVLSQINIVILQQWQIVTVY